jgi:hypothetical protein
VKYLYFDYDGRARRCVVEQDAAGDPDDLGNLFGEVQKWDGPRRCHADVCTCSDLWQYVELGEEHDTE